MHDFPSSYLLLFDAFTYLHCSIFMGSEQADDIGLFWVQNVTILIADHLIQL